MEDFKVIVAGSRTFDNYAQLRDELDFMLKNKLNTHRVKILSGCARGADSLGERYANERGLGVMKFAADWDKHGKAAGHIRNQLMVDEADAAVFFWDLESSGTKDCIQRARGKGIRRRVVMFGPLYEDLIQNADEIIEWWHERKSHV